MSENGISLMMVEDTEGRRDLGLRYLSGQPGDALLFLCAAKKQCVLAAWDVNMARLYGDADAIVALNDWGRRPETALPEAAKLFKLPYGSKIEVPPATPYPLFLRLIEAVGDYDVLCREEGAHKAVKYMRAVKDADEIAIYRKVSAFTNKLMDEIEKSVRNKKIKTEMDVALLIDARARDYGGEGLGFETLAAGPTRSFGIHAFPAYTAGPFGGSGCSILDFGIKYLGYTSDVTMTFVGAPISATQQKLINLVEKAAKIATPMMVPGASCREIALAVDKLFSAGKRHMPHGLGHGVGLEAHEAPLLNSRSDNDDVLQPGMVVTLEPGLYHETLGGVRLENDILITEKDNEVLTKSRIVRL
jgi:Xaa-Pro dipeptidase